LNLLSFVKGHKDDKPPKLTEQRQVHPQSSITVL
jgi:hypothetical protein